MIELEEEVLPGARPLAWHAAGYVGVNVLLATAFLVNKGRLAMHDINGIFDYWPLWVHLGWGSLLAVHYGIARRTRR